jgi:excisionase family DNA binding protein
METTVTAAALPLVLRVSDVQRVMGISRVTAYELVHQQGFPLVRVGRVMRVPRDAFLRWLEAQARAGGEGT